MRATRPLRNVLYVPKYGTYIHQMHLKSEIGGGLGLAAECCAAAAVLVLLLMLLLLLFLRTFRPIDFSVL